MSEGHGGGLGSGGYCVCPKCGYRKPHVAGVRCVEERCPTCGKAMVREGSYHHKMVINKKSGEPASPKDLEGK